MAVGSRLDRGLGKETRNIPEAHQHDPGLSNGRSYGGVAERAEFALTFPGISGHKAGIDISGVTAQLGQPVLDPGSQKVHQTGDADLLEVGPAAPLAVEFRHAANLREVAHDQPVPLGDGENVGKHVRKSVHVVVGIQMRRWAAEKLFEARQLSKDRGANAALLRPVEIGMQPHAEARRRTGQSGRLRAPRAIDQKAGAREDSMLMGFENAPIDSVARAEVVSIDNQILHAGWPPQFGSTGSRLSNQPRTWDNSSWPPDPAPSPTSAAAGQMIRLA